jgi:hypothetical protein
LSQLDSAPSPAQPRLIAEVEGEAVATISIADGTSVANPFRPTAAIVELLRVRCAQLATERSACASRPGRPLAFLYRALGIPA